MTVRQARMARAALGLSLAQVADAIGCSHMTIRRFEQADNAARVRRMRPALEAYYVAQGIVFGAHESVYIQREAESA